MLTQRSKAVEVLYGVSIGAAIFFASMVLFSADAKIGVADLAFLFFSALISPLLAVRYWEGALFGSTLLISVYFAVTKVSSPWLRFVVAAWLNVWLLWGVLSLIYLFGWW